MVSSTERGADARADAATAGSEPAPDATEAPSEDAPTRAADVADGTSSGDGESEPQDESELVDGPVDEPVDEASAAGNLEADAEAANATEAAGPPAAATDLDPAVDAESEPTADEPEAAAAEGESEPEADAEDEPEPVAAGDSESAADADADADAEGEPEAAVDAVAQPGPEAPREPASDAEPVDFAVPAQPVTPEPASAAERGVADGTATAIMAPTVAPVATSPTRTPLLDAVAAAGAVNVPTTTPPEIPVVPVPVVSVPVVPSDAAAPAVAAPLVAAASAVVAASPVVAAPVNAPPVNAPPVNSPQWPSTTSAPSAPPAPGQVVRVPGIPGRPVPAAASPEAPASLAATPSSAPTEATAPLRTEAPVGSAAPAAPGAASAPVASASTGGASPVPVRVTQVAEESSSPLDVFAADSGRRRWPRVLLWILSIVVVLGAVYVGACYAVASKVPRGATVAGVDIGGLDQAAAVAALQSGLTSVTTEPIAVTAGDITGTIDPASAGLMLDAPATVSRLVGFDLHPVRLWNLLFGVGVQEPVTHVDDAALTSAIEALGGSLSEAPVDGAIVFADGTPHETAAADGWNLDTAAAAQALRTQWLTAARPLTLATVATEPDITQAETDKAMTEVATRVTSAPVAVQVGGQLVSLPVKALASVASFVAQDSALTLKLDGPKLVTEVLARTTNLLTASANAHFEFQNDAPVIVPGQAGTTLDPQELADAVAAAALASDRTATVELSQTDPAQSTDKLTALGIKEIVSEFATPLTSEPKRTANITNGAAHINGTLVQPDGTFSLTEALGPVTAANGFIDAGVLVGAEHVQGMGGGLSQVSTTTFNAAYFAGYADIEHHPHTEWFSRYPEGREATIYTGVLDMKWKNTTPYGALVQAWVADNQVHVRIWSTKYWTVETSTSARSNVTAPTTVYSQTPTCVASSAGNPGFKVTTTRTLSLDGVVKETKSFTWTYKPQNKIICGPAPTTPVPPAA
ncbi:hypothetical protein BH11ACT1_BH11ACT1_11930 [soil metagenome]